MDIALVGYGRMGRMVHEEAQRLGFSVVSVTDPFSSGDAVTDIELCEESLKKADCVIDFSSPSTVVSNMRFYMEHGLRAVIGTTGWYENMDEIRALCLEKGGALMWSGNFSIGVQVMLKAASYLSYLMDSFTDYDVSIHEIHHREKADSPSGTALMLADRVLERMERKSHVLLGNAPGKIDKDALQITSERNGYVPGVHTLTFDSPADTLKIEHTARSRSGFAVGALMAAKWLKDRKGFYSMDDFMEETLGRYQE